MGHLKVKQETHTHGHLIDLLGFGTEMKGQTKDVSSAPDEVRANDLFRDFHRKKIDL